MSQLPQNNEAFDYNPEYAKLYEEAGNEQSSLDTSDERLMPANESPIESSDEAVGKRAANLSLLFGVLSPLSLYLVVQISSYYPTGENIFLVIFASPFLNILGIWQGFVARRRGAGVRAIGGLLLNGLELCIFIGIVVLIIMFLIALSNAVSGSR
ncbi:hypothetical protein [uncultured Rothia sp.]|uniref:hypothetical protein n=1 Tax=uncultured Rothia sp. TaxID=316088 RepID=UPI0028DC2D30|nr:hypothetical protein [uncultured Rothia sp.]